MGVIDGTGSRGNTNRMVHEEQGIIWGPRWSRITVWGGSAVGTEATQLPSETRQLQGKNPRSCNTLTR